MNVKGYLTTMKKLQDNLLIFLESSDNFTDEFTNFTYILTEQLNQNEILKDFLNLLSKISLNHKRTIDFFKKIEHILTFLKKDILSKISNTSLFNIFQYDKRILLFLIKNEFLKIDEYVYNHLVKTYDFTEYFMPEIISCQMKSDNDDLSFERNREIGENDSYICQLIRNDSIEEFIIHISKANLSLETQIKPSIFETNAFLLNKKDISLIEYAAFFGSIQIVQYLHLNNVKLNQSLWFFAIHSNSSELIHFLENNHVQPNDGTYQEYFEESIKCYHNDIANHIHDTLLEDINDNDNFAKLIGFYNFDFCPNDLGNKKYFNYLCRYDYCLLVSIVIKNINPNQVINNVLISNLSHTIV